MHGTFRVTAYHYVSPIGRHNIKTIQMWALFGNASYSQGSWGFFSPCTSRRSKHPNTPNTPNTQGFFLQARISLLIRFNPAAAANSSVFTTSMINDDACNQYVSINSTGQVGEVSASASYMVAEAALPFSAPGHMRGLTLQRLFRKVNSSSPSPCIIVVYVLFVRCCHGPCPGAGPVCSAPFHQLLQRADWRATSALDPLQPELQHGPAPRPSAQRR